jgi:threonine/homoserine/homoserine lactone efflux protein
MEHVLAALTFGLVAGLQPGPLSIFVIDQTLRNGLAQGFRASLAPFITDGPIIVLALLLSISIQEQSGFIAIMSYAGGLYIAYLAIKILMNSEKMDLQEKRPTNRGLWTSVKINALNPSPYLFWFTIGGSYIVTGTTTESTMFVVLMLSTLCLSKFSVAALVYSMGKRLNLRWYGLFLKALAFPLLYFSFSLIYDGFLQI